MKYSFALPFYYIYTHAYTHKWYQIMYDALCLFHWLCLGDPFNTHTSMLFFSTAAECSGLFIFSPTGGYFFFLTFTWINDEIFQRENNMRKFWIRKHKINPLLTLNLLRFSNKVLVSWRWNTFVSEKHSIFHLHYNFHISPLS